jgi:hypothetical protein
MWRCGSCKSEFTPDPPDFSCPNCRSNATAPVDSRIQLEREGRRVSEEKRKEKELEEREPDRFCPECHTAMRLGVLVERNTPLHFITIGEGIYWSPSEVGLIGTRVALKSYACPGCGYVNLYIRRLEKDREIILKAPVKTKESII